MEEHVIYGRELRKPVSNESVGTQLLNALKCNEEQPLLVNAFTGECVSNKNVLHTSCRLGQSLRNVGLKKTAIIGIYSENNLNFFDPVLAALYSGISVVTISSQFTSGELIYAVNLIQPSILFCSVKSSSTFLKAKSGFKVVPKILIINQKENCNTFQSVENFISEHISKTFDINKFEAIAVNMKEDVALILFSSGTTGLPKGVMITHLNVNTVFAIYGDDQYSGLDSTTIMYLPLYHAYGLFSVFLKILYGAKVVIMDKFDPHTYLKTIEDYKVYKLQLVPSIAQFLAKTDLLNRYNLSSVKEVFCSAAPLSKDIEHEIVKRFNIHSVRQGYGLTEATLGVMGHPPNEYALGTIGSVLPSLAIKIIDVNTGKSLGPMNTGEICCRGDVIMKGYFNNLEATKNVIDEQGWLHTGDLGYYDNNGLFYIVDRLKELIKCEGYQVPPAELEAILLSHPKITDAGVIGVPNDRYGEVPFAFIVKMSNQKISEKEIEDFVARQVASYKRLRGGVKFVTQIPRNPSGKILRRLLRNEAYKYKSNL